MIYSWFHTDPDQNPFAMFSARAAAALALALVGTGAQIVVAPTGTGGSQEFREFARQSDPFQREQLRSEVQRMTRSWADYDGFVMAHDFGPDDFAWTRIGDSQQRYRNAAAPSVAHRPAQPQSGYG